MSKPAPKEPSMDEILSSIRQIIADDDAAGGMVRRPAPPAPAAAAAPEAPPRFAPEPVRQAPAQPLTLSPNQIVRDEPPAPAGSFPSFDIPEAEEPMAAESAPQLVDPEDVSFEPEAFIEPEPEPEPAPVFHREPEPVRAPPPPPVAAVPAYQPAPPVAEAAPMPDPTLSRDMAETLLGPTSDAAVRHAFGRLGPLALGNGGVTLEGMIRDMLRPMLKEWLDENLPSVVERMVEKEIARVARGID